MADLVMSTETGISTLDNAHHAVTVRERGCSLRPRYLLLFVSAIIQMELSLI